MNEVLMKWMFFKQILDKFVKFDDICGYIRLYMIYSLYWSVIIMLVNVYNGGMIMMGGIFV